MASIASHKRSRAAIKSSLTRFRQYIDAFISERNVENSGDPVELNLRMSRAENLLTQFNETQQSIRDLDVDSALTDELDAENTLFESTFFRTISKAQQLLRPFEEQESRAQRAGTPANSEITHHNVKIPTIALKHYDGSYEEWEHFYDMFLALVGSDASLSNVQKLYYLQSVLKDKAAQVISSLAITGENYTVALDLLKNRFENKRLTKRYHVRALLDIQPVTKESAVALRALYDDLCKHLRALEKLKEPVDKWDTLILELISNKLDTATKREWEQKVISENWKKTDDLKTFLANRCEILEAMQKKDGQEKPQTKTNSSRKSDHTTSHVSTNNTNSCPICAEDHKVYQCQKLRDLPVQSRINEVKRLNLCLNCLGKGHGVKTCKAGNCRLCQKRHNSLLHLENQLDSAQQKTSDSQSNADKPSCSKNSNASASVQSVTACAFKRPAQVLLSTAIVYVENDSGQRIEARVLLDSGSQPNFITQELCDRLNLPKQKIQQSIGAIAQAKTAISEASNAKITSRFNSFSVKLRFSVLQSITENLPLSTFNAESIEIPKYVVLADPSYHIPQKIDMLLGAGVFWDLLCAEQVRCGRNKPIIQKTKLGWVVSGPYTARNQTSTSREFCGFSSERDLQENVQRFWQIEEVSTTKTEHTLSREELACEQHFRQTHTRLPGGRFEVRLPLRESINKLGESYGNSLKRLRSIERKFVKFPCIKPRYTSFMDEYEEMQHMTEVKDEPGHSITNYLPHHAVVNEERITTKLRVVFDASCPTTTGKSLNDLLMVGPTVQHDLVDIVLRFRQHPYVLTADVSKMYRQVSVSPEDRDLQRILCRTEVNTPPKVYRLNTLTYGTGSAPFLATRCLVELALENATKYPEASEIIKRDFYVDDLITGGSNIEELRKRKHNITQILLSGAFPLAKWNSNSKQVLETAASDPSISNNIGEDTKILGLRWRADTDQLYYHVDLCEKELRPTKRLILSFIAQLFDPLGLIGPAIIKAKILLQHLWQLHVRWDETLPMDIYTQWMQYKTQIANLNNIIVPRHVLCTDPVRIELHGFCDASTKAYGACLYLKSVDSLGLTTVRLLCAKSRVAPLKTLTLPRLELCGALLLARLYRKMHVALTVEIHCNYFWSDSSVTLAWIRGEPCRWKEFVRNRVIEIQELTLKDDWKHVRSEDNPADIISRGINPDQLLNTRIWWQGPEWLSNNEDTWPISSCPPVDAVPEAKATSVALTTHSSEVQLIERYSSLTKLQRVLAFVLRFKNNAKASVAQQERQTGPLTTEELTTSLDVLVKIAQQQQFAEEFEDLKKKRDLNSRSKLLSLNPYIDDKNIIRVGGRLRNAQLSHDAKFPILLPPKHTLTRLIILHYHHRNLHAGPSALLAALRERYWIISSRNVVRSVLRKCVTCFKLRPVSPVQLMGDLPSERVTPSRAFSVVGVDYAGPFNVKVSRNTSSKAYLCLFVCLATKAIHLEIVSDMTTEGFLNSFKRFISRRGRCRIIQSDNGSNFVGASNVMKKVAELLASKSHQERVINFAAKESIDWKFIPPYSPHVGGLWESAVKSAKTHAKAVIGETKLSFEELSTVFCQIEACLNSRPLFPLSTDPNELEALTPGHFLIGTSLCALPEEDVSDVPLNRLYRYQLLTRMNQDFWRRWSKEYVTQLQQRNKWKIKKLNENIKIGAMVLLRDSTPPLNWRLGRIIDLHPGKDGLIRTVTLKTHYGTTQRTLPKICVLPLD